MVAPELLGSRCRSGFGRRSSVGSRRGFGGRSRFGSRCSFGSRSGFGSRCSFGQRGRSNFTHRCSFFYGVLLVVNQVSSNAQYGDASDDQGSLIHSVVSFSTLLSQGPSSRLTRMGAYGFAGRRWPAVASRLRLHLTVPKILANFGRGPCET